MSFWDGVVWPVGFEVRKYLLALEDVILLVVHGSSGTSHLASPPWSPGMERLEGSALGAWWLLP